MRRRYGSFESISRVRIIDATRYRAILATPKLVRFLVDTEVLRTLGSSLEKSSIAILKSTTSVLELVTSGETADIAIMAGLE